MDFKKKLSFNKFKKYKYLLTIIFSFFSFYLYGGYSFAENLIKKNGSIIRPNLEYINKIPINEYIIGTGDVFKIIVSKNLPELTKIYKVDGIGTIFLDRLGQKHIKGLSIQELSNLLEEAYKEYILAPEIQIKMISYRPVKVYVDGEVGNPGIYTLKGNKEIEDLFFDNLNMNPDKEKNKQNLGTNQLSEVYSYEVGFPSLFDVLRTAGGVNNYSDLTNIEIIRDETLSNGGGKKRAFINFLDVFETGNSKQNIRIFDNDIIKISKSETEVLGQLNKAIKTNLNPKFINVLVSGRVDQKGLYNMSKGSALNDAFDMAGGLKVIKGKIKYISYKSDGSLEKRIFKYSENAARGTYKNPYLSSGDIIHVGKGSFNIASEVISEIASPFAGLVNIYGILKIFSE